MQYRYMTQEERDDICAEQMLEREREHYAYQLNIDNFRDMIDAMEKSGTPKEWPENLRSFAGMKAAELAANTDEETFARVSNLMKRDGLKQRIKTEAAEQSLVELVYTALEKRIPEERRPAAMDRVRAKIAASKP